MIVTMAETMLWFLPTIQTEVENTPVQIIVFTPLKTYLRLYGSRMAQPKDQRYEHFPPSRLLKNKKNHLLLPSRLLLWHK